MSITRILAPHTRHQVRVIMETGTAYAGDGSFFRTRQRSARSIQTVQLGEKTNVPVVHSNRTRRTRRLNQNILVPEPPGIENARNNGARKTRSFEHRQSCFLVTNRSNGLLVPANLGVTENTTLATHDLQGGLLIRPRRAQRDGDRNVRVSQNVTQTFEERAVSEPNAMAKKRLSDS